MDPKGKITARVVTMKDDWGVERVVGGFGDVGPVGHKTVMSEERKAALKVIRMAKRGIPLEVMLDNDGWHAVRLDRKSKEPEFDGPHPTVADGDESPGSTLVQALLEHLGVKVVRA